MRYVDKVVIWISPAILLMNILVLCCSTIILTKDFSSYPFLKQLLAIFTVFFAPVSFILYVVSILNVRKNKVHSYSAMAYIMLVVIIMNGLTFPFTYSHFYKQDIITVGLFAPVFFIMLYTLWVVTNIKKTPRA